MRGTRCIAISGGLWIAVPTRSSIAVACGELNTSDFFAGNLVYLAFFL